MWSKIWGYFLLAILFIFTILETIGLLDKRKGDTLSENTRKWLNTSLKRWLFGIGAILGTAWFIWHILWQ